MANRQNIAGKLSIHVSICCISHDHEAKDLDDNNDNNDNLYIMGRFCLSVCHEK